LAKTYVTVQGDMWDIIAKKTLGDEYLFPALIDANPEHRETVIFSANVTLQIPEVTESEVQNLPPWLEDDGDDEL
jgi:phage tail protein X